jgi:3-deoxy-D-manno-octulosonic-acid transferase
MIKINKIKFFAHICSIVWRMCFFITKFFSKKIMFEIKLRKIQVSELQEIEANRRKYTSAVLFFCSSAGEYEQALPILKKLKENKKTYLYILFFSKSGYSFARKRNETTPMRLYYGESFIANKLFFAALKPSCTVVIRHEIWPVFISTASSYGKLFLVNFYQQPFASYVTTTIKKILLLQFDFIYTINISQQKLLHEKFCIPKTKCLLSSDTKYARAYERKKESESFINELQSNFFPYHSKYYTLVVGSAWAKDAELIASAIKKLKPYLRIKTLIVPHKLSQIHIESIAKHCRSQSLIYEIIDKKLATYKNKNLFEKNDVIIFKQMGLLFELYSLADLAFVGGALHHRVHNVLEPFVYNIPIAFGPKYRSSPEAIELIKNRAAQQIKNPAELISWCETNSKSTKPRMKAKVQKDKLLQRHISQSHHIAAHIAKYI